MDEEWHTDENDDIPLSELKAYYKSKHNSMKKKKRIENSMNEDSDQVSGNG